ncbi:MAG: HEAT repeat domain-containing protein [Thermoguttaceae bacterium]|jgi:HEAT repeat protein
MHHGTKLVVAALALAWPGALPSLYAAVDPPGSLVRTAALESLNGPDEVVRVAAIHVLGRIGTAGDVPRLAELATTGGSDALREAAFESLVAMRRPQIDAALLAQLKTAKPRTRATLIRCLAERRPRDALPAVLQRAEDEDAEVRLEAFKALQVLADTESVPALIALLVKSTPGEERESAELAMCAACRRITDHQRQADPLLAALVGADVPQRCALLPVLGRVGGRDALGVVRAARSDAHAEVAEAAIRALCNWPDADVATELFAIAKDGSKPQHRSWAVRALARVIPRADDRTPQERTLLLQQTMTLARQADDKRLVLSRLAAVRTPEALATALSSTADPELRGEAIKAVVELARGLWKSHPQAAREALEKVLRITTDRELRGRIDRILGNPEQARKGQGN